MKPAHLKPRVIGCSVPREIFQQLERVAAERQISISEAMRDAIVKSYGPARRDGDPDN